MPIIIIGGMKSGVFTPTEAAVVAAFYALVVALFVHREMKLPEIYGVLVRAAKTTSIVVMFLCAGAQVASYMITLADLPSVLTAVAGPAGQQPAPADGGDDGGAGADRHRAGPDAHHPDLRPGDAADRGQGRHRPGVLRPDVRAQRRHRPDHAAGGHGAQRGGRRGPHADAQRHQGREPVPGDLRGDPGPVCRLSRRSSPLPVQWMR
jgi:hypothetical protein